MTPARKAALAWFADRGEVTRRAWAFSEDSPSLDVLNSMVSSGHVSIDFNGHISLTDKGRHDLHEAGR